MWVSWCRCREWLSNQKVSPIFFEWFVCCILYVIDNAVYYKALWKKSVKNEMSMSYMLSCYNITLHGFASSRVGQKVWDVLWYKNFLKKISIQSIRMEIFLKKEKDYSPVSSSKFRNLVGFVFSSFYLL